MQTPTRSLTFQGEGQKLFGIYIINLLLTLLTLGLYYPWARAALLQFYYRETELDGSRFTFHGTGKEMFKGFIKALLIFGVIYGQFYFFLQVMPRYAWIGIILFYVGFLGILPYVFVGSMRYRLSRSSYRGIHFGFRGNVKGFMKMFYRDVFFTVLTFGIYGAWLTVHIRKYMIDHSRYGNMTFSYRGEGGDYFAIYLKGYILTFLTFGIYAFWWMAELYQFYIDNIVVQQGDKAKSMRTTVKGNKLAGVLIVNFLLILCTLGIGAAWAEVRMFKYLMANTFFPDEIDLEAVVQTEEEYKDATGDDLSDMLDLGIV